MTQAITDLLEQINKEITNKKLLLLSLLKEVALIPSPTGSEQQKMLFLKEKLKEIGINASIDSMGNCVAKLPAKKSGGSDRLMSQQD